MYIYIRKKKRKFKNNFSKILLYGAFLIYIIKKGSKIVFYKNLKHDINLDIRHIYDK